MAGPRRSTSFADSTVLVTGASSGIGRETALAFAAAGSNVILVARGAKALAKVATSVRKLGAKAMAIPTDVTKGPPSPRALRRRHGASARRHRREQRRRHDSVQVEDIARQTSGQCST